MQIKRTEQIHLNPNDVLSYYCHLSKNLYNEGNYIIKQSLDTEGIWIRHGKLNKILNRESENYKILPSKTANRILYTLDKNWSSFFTAIKDWKKHPEKYLGKPRPPNYKRKDGEHILIFISQQMKIKDDYLSFPKMTGIEPIKTRLPSNTDLREVRIIPQGIGYICEIIYNKEVDLKELNPDRIIGIDLGMSNIITIVNNIGEQPIIIKDDGTGIKSINQFHSKRKAELQSIYDKQGIKSGIKMNILNVKHDKKVNDYIHKLSRFIINYCIIHNIGTIIFGYNEGWKQEVNLGKRNNQSFAQIPYMNIIKKTTYKAEEIGIDVIKQEESYTSKCSFIDNELIEHHNTYLGKRFTRSLFKSAKGIIIHSDCNGGYNIIKKAKPEAFNVDGIGRCGLHPLRINLLKSELYNTKICVE